MARGGFLREMGLFFSANDSPEQTRLSKKEEKFLQESSFFIFMSVSNQISFFANILELIYPN